MTNPRSVSTAATTLGWFSIVLGLVEIAAPRQVAQSADLDVSDDLVRGFGVREVVNGIGLLAGSRPAPWLWGRAAGDVLDLAVLLSGPGPMSSRRTAALIAIGAVTAVDVCAAVAATSAETASSVPPVSYHDRSGYSSSVEAVRGAALSDFVAPDDMRIPDALRPLDSQGTAPGQALPALLIARH